MTGVAPIVAACLAADAASAATVAADGAVRTWFHGAAAGAGRRLVPFGGGPAAVALSGDIVRVLWADHGMLRLYEEAGGTRERYHTLAAPVPVRAVTLSPSGGAAAVACDDGTVRGLDVGRREFTWVLSTGAPPDLAVAIASDSGPVVVVAADGTVRRHDLRAGTAATVGVGTPATAVAVTPDGEIVVTAAGGVLCRWDSRTGAPPGIRTLDTVITAVALDATGDRVLVGGDDGRLWLHDLTGGPGVEYVVPAGTPLPARDTPQPSHSFAGGPPGPLIDDDVRFTVYRPQVLPPGRWASLVVFAHKTDLVAEPGRPPVDPQEQVEARARAHFSDSPPRPVAGDARQPLSRGARLRIVPDLPGIACNPSDAEVEWWEPVHEVVFRLLAGTELAGDTVRGAVRVWCGPLILGEVSIAVHVAANGPAGQIPPAAQSVRRYRKIFPSYSHLDRAVVAGFAEAARALGDEYLQDVLTIRAGQAWDTRLRQLIEDADVFQLFWSRNSMRSQHCRDEWEHALSLRRPLFVRPLYWEEPLPEDPGHELPPAELRALHFVKVPVAESGPPGPVSAAPAASARPARPGAHDDSRSSPAGLTSASREELTEDSDPKDPGAKPPGPPRERSGPWVKLLLGSPVVAAAIAGLVVLTSQTAPHASSAGSAPTTYPTTRGSSAATPGLPAATGPVPNPSGPNVIPGLWTGCRGQVCVEVTDVEDHAGHLRIDAAVTNGTGDAVTVSLYNATAVTESHRAYRASSEGSDWPDNVPSGQTVEGTIEFYGRYQPGGGTLDLTFAGIYGRDAPSGSLEVTGIRRP